MANARILSAFLPAPSSFSTPEDTSTPSGCTASIAMRTLSGFKPPASSSSFSSRGILSTSFQSKVFPLPGSMASNT